MIRIVSAGTARNLALNYAGSDKSPKQVGVEGKPGARINEMRLIKMQRNVTYLKLKLKSNLSQLYERHGVNSPIVIKVSLQHNNVLN